MHNRWIWCKSHWVAIYLSGVLKLTSQLLQINKKYMLHICLWICRYAMEMKLFFYKLESRAPFQHPVGRLIIRSRSRNICFQNCLIAFKFDRYLGSTPVDVPVKFQSDTNISTSDQAPWRLCKISWSDVLSDIESEPRGCNHGNTRIWLRWSRDCQNPCSECTIFSLCESSMYFQSPTNFQMLLFAFPQTYGSQNLTNANKVAIV